MVMLLKRGGKLMELKHKIRDTSHLSGKEVSYCCPLSRCLWHQFNTLSMLDRKNVYMIGNKQVTTTLSLPTTTDGRSRFACAIMVLRARSLRTLWDWASHALLAAARWWIRAGNGKRSEFSWIGHSATHN